MLVDNFDVLPSIVGENGRSRDTSTNKAICQLGFHQTHHEQNQKRPHPHSIWFAAFSHSPDPSTNAYYHQSRDTSFTYIHLHSPHHADLFEDFSRGNHTSQGIVAAEEISVRPQDLPINPEDEDDVVPDQHAAFGIQRATQRAKEAGWRDLGLERLMEAPVGNGSGSAGPVGSRVLPR
jgi:hypothetical protein